ncbi:MAG TPA: site-specific integrase [Candidatus Saccharimonadales bacterium]|nr:site-specific integrase [Candidatus Saccharimonadales bacterium]
MKTQEFPIEIKRGSATVKIYEAKFAKAGREYVNYTLSYWHRGKRVRQAFASLQDAKDHAAARATELANGDLSILSLKAEDGAAYRRAMQLLQPCGISLEVAVAQFAEAFKILGGISLIEAAKLAVKAQRGLKPNVTVAETVAELLKDRKLNGVGAHHYRVLDGMLKRVVAAFQEVHMGSVDGPTIKAFLDGLEGVTARTRNNYRQVIGQVFHFAKFRRYVSQDHESVEHISEYKETPGEIEIYTPAEIETLLINAGPKILPFLAIGAFAGVRSAEIGRLDWKDVSLAAGHIIIQANNAKTASRRIVPISENLAQWLAPHEKAFGPVCFRHDMASPLRKFAKNKAIKKSGFKWKHNALRHSYISYRVADLKDVARVALEAGNSPAMIFRHYRELVTADAAKAWFAVRPSTGRKIIEMPTAAVGAP